MQSTGSAGGGGVAAAYGGYDYSAAGGGGDAGDEDNDNDDGSNGGGKRRGPVFTSISGASLRGSYVPTAPAAQPAGPKPRVTTKVWNPDAGEVTSEREPSSTSKKKHQIGFLAAQSAARLHAAQASGGLHAIGGTGGGSVKVQARQKYGF